MTLIGQRSFKETCYFVNFLKNFKKVADPMFEWQVIYFEAYLSTHDTSLVITVTEQDLRQLMSMLKETTNQESGNQKIDINKLYHKEMSNQDLMQLALDVITLGHDEGSISGAAVDDMNLIVSFQHLQQRVKERNMIIANFMETGSRYVRKFAHLEEPEFMHY